MQQGTQKIRTAPHVICGDRRHAQRCWEPVQVTAGIAITRTGFYGEPKRVTAWPSDLRPLLHRLEIFETDLFAADQIAPAARVRAREITR